MTRTGPAPGDDEALWAWHSAYLEHRRRVRAETARYAAECARLRDQHGPPGAGSSDRSEVLSDRPAWYQGDLDELDRLPDDDEVIFRRPDGTWFAADAAAYLPPCEMEG